jgi:hypothetical protein
MTDEEGYLLCVELFESDYSEEDIAGFVMRKFLKNIRNNYSFEINEMNNTVVEEDIVVEDIIPVIDNTIDENNTVVIIDKPVVEEDSVVKDIIPVIDNKPVVENKKKTSKKSEEKEYQYLNLNLTQN